MEITKRVPKREIIPLLTAREVADRMGVDRNRVYELANRAGGLRAYKVGGLLRFKPEEVEAYMRCAPV